VLDVRLVDAHARMILRRVPDLVPGAAGAWVRSRKAAALRRRIWRQHVPAGRAWRIERVWDDLVFPGQRVDALRSTRIDQHRTA